jgi:hypothetical protein
VVLAGDPKNVRLSGERGREGGDREKESKGDLEKGAEEAHGDRR